MQWWYEICSLEEMRSVKKSSGKLMNSEEKSITVGCTACATINAQAGAACLDEKQGISTAMEIFDGSD